MASKISKKTRTLSKPIETKPINISDIVAEVDIQSRTALNSRLVDEYTDDLGLGALFPPVDVFYDGTYYFLTDGFHRFNAHKQSGKKTIEANIHLGSRRDAILFSVGVNATHGLRRSNDDKRKAVFKLLNDEEWVKMSDGEIAKHCSVSQPFVSGLRKELIQNGFESHPVRKGADGREIDVTNIGKKAETDEPELEDDDMEEFELDVSGLIPEKTKRDIQDEDDDEEPNRKDPKHVGKVSEVINEIIGQLTELQKLKPDAEHQSESNQKAIAKLLDKLKQKWLQFNILMKDLL
jgi:uncharacterized ParB-like nuclease family protein